MVNIHVAYTAAINGAGRSPQLTVAQVWEGLTIKIRRAQEFVGVITSTEVLEERVDQKKGVPVTTREVVFKDGFGPPWAKDGRVQEVCWAYEPCKVDFFQPDGSTISNIISAGPGGEEAGDLNMTYAFEWLHPEVDAKDEEKVRALKEKHAGTAKMAVEKSIEAMRKMVVDGRIKA